MKRRDFNLHEFYYLILGGIFGLLASIIRFFGDLIAIILYPGYNLTIHMISFLGTGPGHIFFNLGLTLSAIISIPYYISFAKVFKNEIPQEEKLIHHSFQASIISSFSLCIVAILLELSNIIPYIVDLSNIAPFIFMYHFHAFFAMIAFICAVYSFVITGSLIKKTKLFPQFFAKMCYIIAVLTFVLLVTWNCVVEWLVSSLIIIMQSLFAIHMITNFIIKFKYKT